MMIFFITATFQFEVECHYYYLKLIFKKSKLIKFTELLNNSFFISSNMYTYIYILNL